MKVIKTNPRSVDVNLSLEEIIIINNALNEVCNALDQFEFQTRMGVEHYEVEKLLKQINAIVVYMESKSK